jgi:hypothetical protein
VTSGDRGSAFPAAADNTKKDSTMKSTNRWLTMLIGTSLSFAGFVQTAQATLVSTEQVAASQGVRSAEALRGQVHEALSRADLRAALAERGVSPEQVQERVASLTDAEVAQMAQQIDSAPAGANDILGTIVFIFLVLLVTDILGLTKVFPFTRSLR